MSVDQDGEFFYCWERFRTETIPADAGPIQVEECRRAFYSGAGELLILFERAQNRAAARQSIRAELREFHAELLLKGPNT